MDEYDRICDWFARTRNTTIGVPAVRALIRDLHPGSHVLDLGCGNGLPITQVLIESGLRVYGIDSSTAMLARFQARFPQVLTLCARLQDSDWFETTFDAVIAWGVMFHLEEADQIAAIAKVGRALKPGGRFLFTSALEAGACTGTMNDVLFHYRSLGREAYANLLREQHLQLTEEFYDAWANYHYIAQRGPDLTPTV